MNNKEFNRCFSLAQSRVDLSDVSDQLLYGCSLPDFQPVKVPDVVVAKFIRYQCGTFDGGWDLEALNELRDCFRHKVEVEETYQSCVVDTNGNHVGDNVTVKGIDHYENVVVVKLKHIAPLDERVLKGLLESRWEVLKVTPLYQKVVVKV